MKDKNSEKSASFIVRLKADNEPKSVLGGAVVNCFMRVKFYVKKFRRALQALCGF